MEGREELLASTYSQSFRSAGSDPRRQKFFALAAIMTCRLGRLHKHKSDEDYEDYALTCMASAEYIEDLAADPEALFDHLRFAYRIGKKQSKSIFANAS